MLVGKGVWGDWGEDVAGDCGWVGDSCCSEFDSCLGSDHV